MELSSCDMESFKTIQAELDKQLQFSDEEAFENGEDFVEAQINDQAHIRTFEDEVAFASEAAHAKGTREGYKRRWNQFLTYIIDTHGDKGIHQVYNNSENCPVYIAHWIYLACDEDQLKKSQDNSSSLAKSKKTPNKFSSAQVMRAAASYGFAITLKRGHTQWAQLENGTFIGNPSLSTKVLMYMRSLKRKKVQLGEVASSVRSITSTDIRRLWEYNEKILPIPYGTQRSQHRSAANYSWGGYIERTMMHCIYVLSFLCLLRFDEVLSIQAHNLEIFDKDEGIIMLSLTSRKTHQTGEIKPFGLRWNRYSLWLDPIHALLKWIYVSGIQEGFLFRRISVQDQVTNKPLSPDLFMHAFQHNLLDIGVDYNTYGTHSFRRGGCQYFATERRWNIRQICD